MASSREQPNTITDRGSERSANASVNGGGKPSRAEVYLTVGDLHYVQNASQARGLKSIVEENGKQDKGTEKIDITPAKCAEVGEWRTSSSRRIDAKVKHLAGEDYAGFVAEELEILINQRNREALVERAEGLLLANTEQHRALKAGLMRSDWLGALKEQQKWKQHLKDLDKQREEQYRRIWEEGNVKTLREEHEEKLRLQEKIRELKVCRFRHLEENRAKRENERMIATEEARQLEERIEQENRKFAEDDKKKCARYKQLHLEAMEWVSRAGEEKPRAVKLREIAEEALLKRSAPKLSQLEARSQQTLQRHTALSSRTSAFQPLDYDGAQESRQRKDIERGELCLPLEEEQIAQRRAEQQRTIAEERLRQQQMKADSRAKIDREDAAFAMQWKNENMQALLIENQKKEKRRQRFIETAATLKQQIAAAKEKRQREREDEKRAVRAALSAIEKSEEAVAVLQKRCVQNAFRNGNSHWPIANSLSKRVTSSGTVRHGERKRIFLSDPVDSEGSSEEN